MPDSSADPLQKAAQASDIDQASCGIGEGSLEENVIGLVLAHAALITGMTGFAPVLLLDEVVAHLDPSRRRSLYDALEALGAQVFMTGADPATFADVAARAAVFAVVPGRAEPMR